MKEAAGRVGVPAGFTGVFVIDIFIDIFFVKVFNGVEGNEFMQEFFLVKLAVQI